MIPKSTTTTPTHSKTLTFPPFTYTYTAKKRVCNEVRILALTVVVYLRATTHVRRLTTQAKAAINPPT
jgi:hypothetical protein